MDVATDAGISGDAGEMLSNKREDSRGEGSIKTLVVQIVYLGELTEGIEERKSSGRLGCTRQHYHARRDAPACSL